MSKSFPPYGLSEGYWKSLGPEGQRLYRAIRPMPMATYTVDWHLGGLEQTLERLEQDMLSVGGSFDLNPDFQRGHVWTDAQRAAFVEAMIRQSVTGRILFNCPGWMHAISEPADIPAHTFQCIDGLQRLTAIRRFLAGQIPVFGGMSASALRGTPFDPFRLNYRLQIGVYEFTSRADLLQFYLDLNTGGTAHAPKEIERVRRLLTDAKSA